MSQPRKDEKAIRFSLECIASSVRNVALQLRVVRGWLLLRCHNRFGVSDVGNAGVLGD